MKVNTVLSQKKVDKSDMEETIEESRELRRKLIDTQTNLAMVRSEMENLRFEYETKCEEFNNKYVCSFGIIVHQLLFTYTSTIFMSDDNFITILIHFDKMHLWPCNPVQF